MVTFFFLKIIEYYIKLNMITSKIKYLDMDRIVAYSYQYLFIFSDMDVDMDISQLLKFLTIAG